MEYDLIALGLRLSWLGSERLSWRDLLVIIRQSPPTTALYRASNPDEWQWGNQEMLLAAAVDALHWLQWTKTRDGEKGKNAPEQIPRPGVEPRGKKYGSDPIPMDQMAEWLGWPVSSQN